jgi:hypothetical protein
MRYQDMAGKIMNIKNINYFLLLATLILLNVESLLPLALLFKLTDISK